MKKNVLIIGAGPAGLTAAYELLKTNKYNITILEESNDVGGISKTVKYKNNRMDIGGHRFFSKNDKIMQMWKELLPLEGENGIDPEADENIMLVRNRVSRIYYLKKFFDYPISLKIKTFKNMGLKRTIKAGFSYLKTIFYKRPENSLEDFYINRFGKVLYKMFFEEYTEKLWGIHPSKISADWGAQRVKGLSISKVIKNALHIKKEKEVETSLIEQFWYPKYGPGQLWETLALKIESMGGKINKKCKVEEIYIKENKIEKLLYVKDGTYNLIEGDIFLSSMPIKDLIAGIKGNVPNNIKNIAQGLEYRDFITIGLQLKKLNLKNETNINTIGNIIPDCWIYMQEPNVKMCRIQIFNNWSPYMVENPKENIWIGLEYVCSEKDDIWKMDKNEFKNFAVDELIKINLIEAEDVIDYHIEKMKKAYPAYFGTYSQIDKLINYLNQFENLYCIGRNGQHRYNNMDHSMLTALETVKNIETGSKCKDNIWNVNVEKEYLEKK